MQPSALVGSVEVELLLYAMPLPRIYLGGWRRIGRRTEGNSHISDNRADVILYHSRSSNTEKFKSKENNC